MLTTVPPSVRILYVLENDALSKRLLTRVITVAMHALTQACKSARGPVLKENFYLAVAFRYLLVFTVAPRRGAECRWYLENGTR